jgi:glutathione S-transferase
MKIYGHPMSTCTRKVLMTLAENNTPYELELVDFAKGEHKQPAHLARQPFGQIPSLDDEGFKLYESRAMSRYINDKVGGSLLPKDLRERAKAEQWMSIETSNFSSSAMKFIFHHILQFAQPAETLAAATTQLNTTLAAMDQQLATSTYLAGETFTLGDVCFMPYVEYLLGTPAKELFTKHTHVLAWWAKVGERPTWKKVAGRA